MAPKTASPTTLQTDLQSLTKGFLRFWMVDICGRGRGKTQGPGGDWGWGLGGEKVHARTRLALLSPLLLRLPAVLDGVCTALRKVPALQCFTKAQTRMRLRFVPSLP